MAGSAVLEAHRQLCEYFAGTRREFDLPLRPAGTEFQRRVWDVLATVPWGTTTTYGAIAARLDLPPWGVEGGRGSQRRQPAAGRCCPATG